MTTQEKLETFMKTIDSEIIKENCPFKIEDMFIAGGCIRSLTELQEINDVDIFFRETVSKEDIKNYFKEYLPNGFITENAVGS